AILLGTLAAMGNAAAAANGQSYDPNAVGNSVALGYALGDRAYSQTYELESDTIGTFIAREAGYDPVTGARFFARDEDARSGNGKLSFWGTHPPDFRRVAAVIATDRMLDGGGSLEHRPRNAGTP
ncbi:M48 family metalloprotease, partial [Mangrovicoccus ximenensis]|uniref:M48 family metalloprotease n=1 Tax=Mangrovicoccus ximenensis TaxID=1911570 RepID=UPI0011AE20B6